MNELINTKDFFDKEFNIVFNNEENKKIDPIYFLNNYRSIIFRYVSNGNPSEDTKKTYVSNIDNYLEWCRLINIDPFKVNEQQMLYYRSVLVNSGMKATSIKLKLTAIRRFYFVAKKYKLIETNPVEDVHAQRNPDTDQNHLRFLTLKQLEKLINSFSENSLEEIRTKTILYLMAVEGLRTIEVHRLNVSDINFEVNAIYIRGKGHNDYIYPTPGTMKYLKKYISMRKVERLPGPPVFTSNSNRLPGYRLSRRQIRRDIDAALENCKLKEPGKSCHMLRHTCGTLLYAETKDLQAVKSVLRHRNVEVTSQYAHVQDALVKRYTTAIPLKPED